jgi:hypothetical protein
MNRGLPLAASKNPPSSLLEHQLQQQSKTEGIASESPANKLHLGSASLIGQNNPIATPNGLALGGGAGGGGGATSLPHHEVKSSPENIQIPFTCS